ncbi:MAG TPA: hypothetical protein VLJ37_05985 [bacterium]|nr:hypothetical protein [bacterium]
MQLSRIAAVSAGVTAFFGSCCALPLLLLGLTGTVGFASVLVPYQKYFTLGTVVLLGTAFYLVYGRNPVVCDPPKADKVCNSKSQKITKVLLWVATALAAIFLIGPHFLAV